MLFDLVEAPVRNLKERQNEEEYQQGERPNLLYILLMETELLLRFVIILYTDSLFESTIELHVGC